MKPLLQDFLKTRTAYLDRCQAPYWPNPGVLKDKMVRAYNDLLLGLLRDQERLAYLICIEADISIFRKDEPYWLVLLALRDSVAPEFALHPMGYFDERVLSLQRYLQS